jgi:hypothetical protein
VALRDKAPRPGMSFVLLPLLITVLLNVPGIFADDSSPPVMHVKLILSDSEVFTNDGLAYKVIITNVSRSSIVICGPRVRPPYACVIETKEAGGEWREVWNYSEMMELRITAPIQIASGATWAEYGKAFLSKGKSHVFGKVGKSELRARIRSPIGSYVSDPVPVNVNAWPKEEEPLDTRFQAYGQLTLGLNTIALQLRSADLATLCKRHPSGGVANTLKLMLAVQSYVESGEVDGKSATWSEAFKVLSIGLDEVRRDQLAFLLAFGAMKKEEWKDLAFLVEQVKDDGSFLRSMRGVLEGAIVTGKFPGP